MNTRSIKKYAPIVILALFSVLMIWQNVKHSPWRENNIFRSDVDIYHTYLTAAVVNNDPFFELEDVPAAENYRTQKSPTGKNVVKTSMGVAIMDLPFYYVGHLYALSNDDYKVDGYSEPYQLAVSLSSVFYTLFGLVFLWLVLKRTFSELTSLFTVLFIGFGTNLYFYGVYETGFSHPITFFLLSALLYFIQNWLSQKKYRLSLLLGLILGLIILVRPINILFILPLVILFKERNINWSAYFKNLFLPLPHLLMVVIGGVLVFIPQFIFWKIQTGSILYYSYTEEGFFWLNPHVWDGLFSFRKGWFIYTPLMLFSLFGMFRLYKVQKAFFWAIIAFLPLFLYVTFSWWSWWYGGGFGARTLVDIMPFMALPLASLIDWIVGDKFRIILLLIPSVFIYINIYQSWQYSDKIIHYDSMTWESYKKVFLKDKTSFEIMKLLREPDYKNALKYGVEKESLPVVSDDPSSPVYEKTVQNMMKYIRTDEEWMKAIEKRAIERNQPIDTVLRSNAEWSLWKNK